VLRLIESRTILARDSNARGPLWDRWAAGKQIAGTVERLIEKHELTGLEMWEELQIDHRLDPEYARSRSTCQVGDRQEHGHNFRPRGDHLWMGATQRSRFGEGDEGRAKLEHCSTLDLCSRYLASAEVNGGLSVNLTRRVVVAIYVSEIWWMG
jgi:hypothetical protein